MTNVQDLHIEAEILPLFDFTCNDFSRNTLIDILKHPLDSIEEIYLRQEILKGFIANNNILKAYSYSRLDLLEVHDFLERVPINNTSGKELTFRLLFSEKERHQKRGKFIQLILLFAKLHSFYFTRLNVKPFPEAYKKELLQLNDFFGSFNLRHYELLIREQGLKVKDIVELTEIILQKSTGEQIKQFWKNLFLFEAYLSISQGIIKQGLSFPVFSERAFSIHQFYHPLLKSPVKNSFTADSNVIILTGPNMSGKSTFLKAIGLCVYLGHIGVGIPAATSEMPFFISISVAINLSDNILSGYSHFMTEVINLKKVVIEAAKKQNCFAVFDELFRGTNMEDAVEISATTIKGLAKFTGSIFFISTHLHQLKEEAELKVNNISAYYIDCELKENVPHFTYKLKEGWSDLRVGRLLFEKEGLNQMLR